MFKETNRRGYSNKVTDGKHSVMGVPVYSRNQVVAALAARYYSSAISRDGIVKRNF
jgi:hypothetical protein